MDVCVYVYAYAYVFCRCYFRRRDGCMELRIYFWFGLIYVKREMVVDEVLELEMLNSAVWSVQYDYVIS